MTFNPYLAKKPVQSERPTPEKQLSNLLERAEAEPDKAERWKLLQRVRDLAYSLRFPQAGRSIWPPLVFASLSMVVLALVIAGRTRNLYFYQYPKNYLRVVQNLDPCLPDGSCGKRFIVQSVVDGKPNPETRIYFSEPKHFEAGMTFSWIRFRVIGVTAVTDGWDLVLDEKGLPVLAPNCSFDWANNHVVCEGGKAKF